MTTFQLVTMNNSQPIDIFNMIYFSSELETFYDHVDQNSVKKAIKVTVETMIMLDIHIYQKPMTYVDIKPSQQI